MERNVIIAQYLPSANNPKRLVILGGGESGVGAALLASAKGYEVFLSDKGEITSTYRATLDSNQIQYESGTHTVASILNADLVVKSPGISDKVDILKQIRERNILVVSEIEFASWFTSSKIIAITGSNGKTTVTSLIYAIFKEAGLNVALGGNIGNSFALLSLENTYDYYVLEVSSFQLDDIYTFRPNVAVLTNITPDHLDRYDYNFENYIISKFKITQNQTADDFFVICKDDQVIMSHLSHNPTKAQLVPFSYDEELEFGAFTKNNEIYFKTHKTQFSMSNQELGIKGRHNVYNSMAAGIVGSIYGLRKEQIRQSLANFRSLEHRLETVSKVRGVEFINDSKATNVNSSWYALESMSKPTIWIAGGVDKGNDYTVLEPLVKGKVKAMICLGLDNTKLHASFGKHVDVIINVQSMHDAVQMAYQMGKSGDVVLLSPACASFDLFENYEDRGQQFKDCVQQL
jgi:UDP-N-acetylmuramoylalanine--D-glutamate ligase